MVLAFDEAFPKARLALLLKHFSELDDGREAWRVAYPIHEVLLVVTCATIASCDDFDEIVAWGEHNLAFLRRFSLFYHGVPCARWLRDLLNRVDPALFAACLEAWIAEMWPGRHEVIAIDGKTARRTHDRGKGLKALHEYERNGVANLFMMFAPLEGWRHVAVTDRRAATDYAKVLKHIADVRFPDAARIVLVQDNLSTHTKAALYETFPPAEARRLAERFEWHYSPKHGSWLDLAESELGVLASQCLDRRIANKQTLVDEVAAWEHHRNAHHAKADWHFTTDDARVKLKHLYPAL